MTASLLDLPADDAGWLDFVSARADARLAEARAILERLKDGSPRTTLEKLELWNDAEIAGSEVASATSLLSEVHPDAGVRAAAEQRVEAVDALVAERNLDRDLWAVFADADRGGPRRRRRPAARSHPARLPPRRRRPRRRGAASACASSPTATPS